MTIKISIHTLRVEGDWPSHTRRPKLPCISIHTLRVEGDFDWPEFFADDDISIHTLRVEGDGRADEELVRLVRISIHTLRVEGDCKSAQKISTLLFKSNRPAEKLPTGRA